MFKKKSKKDLSENKFNIKASTLNRLMIVGESLFFLLLIVAIIMVNSTFNKLNKSMEKFTVCENSTSALKENSNYLTEQARLFVVTGDIQYLTNYFNEKNLVQGRKRALDKLSTVFKKNDVEFKRIETAFKQSENLVSIEIYAMKLKFVSEGFPNVIAPKELQEIQIRETDKKLTKEEMSSKALSVLFDGGYMVYKLRIDQNCTQLINDITLTIENELNINTKNFETKLNQMIVFQIILFLCILAYLFTNSILIIRPVKGFLKSIIVDEKFKEEGVLELQTLANTYNEIYELKAAKEKRLKKNAEIDPLTGVMNRRAFDAVCGDFALNENRTVLLMLDVDDFKHVNDNYGHAAGDKVLQTLARELTDGFRATDYVARLGGDEFAVLLTDFKGIVEEVLEMKIGKINDNLSRIEGIGPVSISVGAAVSDEGFSNDMFDKADKALYDTKKKGKRGFSVFFGEDNIK